MITKDMPLVIFTLCQQMAIGAFFFCALLKIGSNIRDRDELIFSRRFFFIAAIIALGLIASIFHLGSPQNSLNAFNRLGPAWLSNEVFITGLFIACTGLFWLLAQFKPELEGARRLLFWLATFMGLVLLFAMSKLYMMQTVPTWNNCFTPLSFILSALLLGALAGLFIIKGLNFNKECLIFLDFLGITAIFIAAIMAVAQVLYWSKIDTSATNALEQIPDYLCYMYARLGLMLLAFLFWLKNIISYQKSYGLYSVIFILLLTAEAIGRTMFYAVHTTVGF